MSYFREIEQKKYYDIIVDEEEFTLPGYFPITCGDCGMTLTVDGRIEEVIEGHVRGVMDADPDEIYEVCPYCHNETHWILPPASELEEWLGEDELAELIHEGMKVYGQEKH